jgi:hypothetical protein
MMVSLYYVIQEMHSFSMRPAKYFYDKPLPKYLDSQTVLIYRPHPVCLICGALAVAESFWIFIISLIG